MTLQILFRFDQLLTVVIARYKTEILEINKIKFRFGSWDFFQISNKICLIPNLSYLQILKKSDQTFY